MISSTTPSYSEMYHTTSFPRHPLEVLWALVFGVVESDEFQTQVPAPEVFSRIETRPLVYGILAKRFRARAQA